MILSFRRFINFFIAIAAIIPVFATDPTATRYNAIQCEGSLTPYPVPEQKIEYPDSLTPVHINHVGRHGARFPAGPANSVKLMEILTKADSLGSITTLGHKLMDITREVIERSHNQWGALDSLGMAEQRGIASRMFINYPRLFDNAKINAISSYSPRCMMSMFCFTHQLDRLNNHIDVTTVTGRINSALMRPFDIDQDYLDFRKSGRWAVPYNNYCVKMIPLTALRRVVGEKFPLPDNEESREMALIEYYVIAGLNCMSMDVDALQFFTIDEYNALWSCFNLRQYLQRTASTVSTVPANITSPLILDLIATTDGFINGTNEATVDLRFGHAETLMPLLSQMRLRGCYYMTNYFDTVGLHWKDFHVVPMAANLQMILFKSESGNYYVRTDLNEVPVPLIPGNDAIYVPWDKAKEYLTKCVPLYYNN